ncbi:MAG: hypothetical protein ACP5RM_00865 [Candidatus Micrarchaeia archaeon]
MLLEYLLTLGILIAFFGLLVGIVLDRRNILQVMKRNSIGYKQLAIALAISFLFIALEVSIVKPTQQLFFDDAIYQGMALDMIHMGQALMCDYGTPVNCFIGEIFHEPIGTAFNFAIAFLIFGVKRAVAYDTELFLAALSVFLSFFVTSIITKNNKIGYFTELFMALSPVILVWAFPTTSDMPTLAYSMVALLFVLVFMEGKNIISLSNALLSISLLSYMKVVALLYILIFAVIYILLDGNSIADSIKNNLKLLKSNILNTKILLILLIFIISMVPETIYTVYESVNGVYGVTMIQNTCSPSMMPMNYTGRITFANFRYNFCGNVLFWFNKYSYVYIMQPVIFTIFAIIGSAFMITQKRFREFLAIGIWFAIFFLLYTSFYAGGVIYGVDWRFMLSLIYQASFFSGIGAWAVFYYIGKLLKIRKFGKNMKAAIAMILFTVLIIVIFYPLYSLYPLLSINPSSILQAGSARFDENFIYTNISSIPSNCLVFTYVPYLFNINNRSAAQMFYLFNNTFMENAQHNYSCLVIDYGYWCETPGNICTPAMEEYTTTPLKTAVYSSHGSEFTFGFYKITGRNMSYVPT